MIISKSIRDEIESDMHEWLAQFIEKQEAVYASADSAETDPPNGQDASEGKIKPFHKALLPKSFMRMSSFERSFSASLGKSYERHSALIAKARFATAELQHRTEGTMLKSVDTEISDEVGRINKGHVFENYFDVIDRILEMQKSGTGKTVARSVTSDLYLKTDEGDEIFFEIKSPKPNKEQCLNITRKHLWIHAMLNQAYPAVKTYFGMAYNPYGEGNRYRHSFATKHLDIKRQTLIGKQYWDFLGGEGTFEELLEIYRKVGEVKSKTNRKILDM